MGLSIPTTPPYVSVNRVRIVDLPGLPVDGEVRGRLAHEVFSNAALVRYAREQAAALRLPPEFLHDTPLTRRELPRFVDTCLDEGDDSARAAEAVGRRLGRNLGYVLLSLHRGDPVNRAARAEWGDGEWARWAAVEQVWLGGGLMGGRLGALILQHTQNLLAESGYAGRPHIALTPYREATAVLGAARYLPAGTHHAVCVDFGHTLVKRAALTYADGTLVRVRLYPSLAVNADMPTAPLDPDPVVGRQILDFAARAIAQTWADCAADGLHPGPDVMVSVAAYVEQGRLLGNGLYANLHALSADARPLLAAAVRQLARLPRPSPRMHLIHDGTAAGALHAGEPDSIVLVAGTAIGVGFPPASAEGLRPLAPHLAFERVTGPVEDTAPQRPG